MVRNSANTNPHRRAEKVQIGAAPYRGAPIRTCPTPAADTDLLGDEIQTPRTNSRPEAAALVEVLKALRTHPAVAWAERMNTGAAKVEGRFIRFLERIRCAGGVAFVARDCRDVLRALGEAQGP